MHLPAHTNEVGHHVLSDWRYDTAVGKVWDYNLQDWVPFERTDASYLIHTDLSDKPPPVHGDRHRNYDYSRGIQQVVADSPGSHRVSWYNPSDGHTASYDWVETSHLSGKSPPLTSFPGVSDGIRENMWNQTKTECLNKLLDEKAAIGASLGEAHQTIAAFSALVTDGVRYLNAFKHGNLRAIMRRNGGKSLPKSVSDAWLQYSYGWKPLAGDIADAQANVHRTLAKGLAISAKRGSNYEANTERRDLPGDYNESQHIRHRVICELGAVIDSPSIAYLNSFGLINPASIAWELVPWSFAIDWFVPVGKTLEALTATVGLIFNGGRITEHREYSLTRAYNPGRRTAWRVCETEGTYAEVGFGFSRTALTAFPHPAFYADMTPYSSTRALNALALVHQLTHR